MLLQELAFTDETDKSETFVNFSKIEYDVVFVSGVVQSDCRATFFVKLQ